MLVVVVAVTLKFEASELAKILANVSFDLKTSSERMEGGVSENRSRSYASSSKTDRTHARESIGGGVSDSVID